MKLSLFLITLLATISALPISLHPKFLATSADVDPNAIASLKEFVEQLITEGEDERTRITGVRDDAQTVLDQESSDLVDAENTLKGAQDQHTAKGGVAAEKSADELATRSVRERKLAIKKEKKSVLDGAKSFEATEQVRLNNEKALFEKVKTLLRGVAAADRRLLNTNALDQALALLKATLMQKTDAVNEALALLETTDNADPDQVNEALALLDSLIEAGEEERTNVVAALTKAQNEFDAASAVHADAVAVHTLAEGALEDASIELQDAKDVLALRTTEHRDAVTDKTDASNDLDAKQQNLDFQNDRIDSEKLDLQMINDLLGKLD